MADTTAFSTGQGLVKEVQSGDCLTILVKGAGNELVLTLASLDAPRLSRRNGDAPFAQASREFLRSKCAGKLVNFRVEYKVPSIGRTFGTVFVNELSGLDSESKEVLDKIVEYMEKKYIAGPMKMAKEILLDNQKTS